MVIPVHSLASTIPAEAHEALAAGQTQSDAVLQVLAQAERMEQPHADGRLVWHVWQASSEVPSKGPVVLFHGGSGSWTHWARNVLPLREAGYTVWAIDLPGFGDSDGVAGGLDADTMLPVLIQALEQQFVQQTVALVGFSFGGMTAAMLAAEAPHLLHQLVLVGAPGMGLRAEPEFRLRGWRHLESASEQIDTHAYNLGTLMLWDAAHIDRDALALHIHNVRRDRLPRRRLSSTPIVRESLPRITCPVTVLYGVHDVLYTGLISELEQAVREVTPQLRHFEALADAGHWVQYEAAERFNAVLLRELARS